MEFPTEISPSALNCSMAIVFPSINPFSAKPSIAPRVPSSSNMVEACWRRPICGTLRATAVRRPRSESSSDAEAKAISTKPNRRRFRTNRISRPAKEGLSLTRSLTLPCGQLQIRTKLIALKTLGCLEDCNDLGRMTGYAECAGINRHVVGDERTRAAMLADIPVGESPIGGSAQLPP